jgi:iron complex transport system permease protein
MTRARTVTMALALGGLLLAALLLLAGGVPGRDATGAAILLHIRLPRVLLAALVGAMLGLSGTLLQTVLRNPLATPDVVGFGGGAAAAVAASIAVTGGLGLVLPAALAGGLASAALILGLAARGGMPPQALVMIGVAVNLTLLALTDVLLSLAPGLQAGETARFLTGSFASAHWGAVAMAALVVAAGGALAGRLSFGLARMDMGDDMARAQGLAPGGLRLGAAALAAVLVSFAVALTGPLPFVALLAGPLARALLRQGGPVLPQAALLGALLALAADLAARATVFGGSLPAGLYTALVGGPAMLVLILTTRERG